MTTSTKSETAAKKDVAKLQRAIVDGLEDVKAQDIQVFNTEHLSPLFERVIVASGTSNRQTKALASSVRDAVKEAGFPKPRIEGEDNGEWIIVDCGSAVAHIMQPAIRQYYRLEELWGDTYETEALQRLRELLSGGGDVLMGSVMTRDPQLHLRLKATHMRMGWGVGVNDVEAVLRALPSLPLPSRSRCYRPCRDVAQARRWRGAA